MDGSGADGLAVRPGLVIPECELRTEGLRAGGPGGQNVNKVSSGVMLRFDVAASSVLSIEQKALIRQRLDARMTKTGELVLRAVEHREHSRNLSAARERLAKLLAEALHRPPPRRPTRPTRSSQRRRLAAKRRQGERKADRAADGAADA